jgi:hypothetical protein
VAVDALDHARVEPDAGREREAAPIEKPEIDRLRRPAIGEPEDVLGGVDHVVGDPEHLREHVVRAARQDGERRLRAGEPVGDLVDRAVAAERDHDVERLAERGGDQLGRVPAVLGVDRLDVVATLECVDDQVLEPV